MKHKIEFHYDGCDMWAYNGGRIMSPLEVQMFIGREAFFEAMKHGASFKATLDVIVEPIKRS